MRQNELRQSRHVIPVKHGDLGILHRTIGGNRHHCRIIACQRWMVEIEVAHLDLVVSVALVAFDDDKIAGLQLRQHLFE